MPKNKNETLCVEDLRHAEYYEMQNTFDDLYAKSKNGDIFHSSYGYYPIERKYITGISKYQSKCRQ